MAKWLNHMNKWLLKLNPEFKSLNSIDFRSSKLIFKEDFVVAMSLKYKISDFCLHFLENSSDLLPMLFASQTSFRFKCGPCDMDSRKILPEKTRFRNRISVNNSNFIVDSFLSLKPILWSKTCCIPIQ